MKIFTTLFVLLPIALLAQNDGPFAPEAGEEGSTAVPLDDERILRWADMVESYEPVEGAPLSAAFSNPEQALGPAEGNVFQIVSLAQGELVVSFQEPLQNGEGPELAVYENSFNNTFLELAFVEVSSDGVYFERFPNQSLTPEPINGSQVFATNIDGLAGKYRGGFGTPFDLQDLPQSPLLDLDRVRFVRLIDIVAGNQGGRAFDSFGRLIFDSFLGGVSTGFDCDGVAALSTPEFVIPVLSFEPEEGGFRFTWESRIGGDYCVEISSTLQEDDWQIVHELVATEVTSSVLVESEEERLFVRVRRK